MSRNVVTLADIARKAGVSKNTVSLALRQSSLLPKETRERICLIAGELGYKRNPTLAHLMTELRSGRTTSVKSVLALLNANVDQHAFRRDPTVRTYVEGCHRRAAELGYGLDEFWLYDPQIHSSRLSRVFKSRDIRGAVIVGLLHENHLPSHFSAIWNAYPCVVTGVRTHNPTFSFTAADQYALALNAVEQALRIGYKRPALVLDPIIDTLVEGRYSAGFHVGQQQLSMSQRMRPFYLGNKTSDPPERFQRWLEQEKPDVILTLYHPVKKWLADLNHQVPEDVGLIQLEWRPDHADWAGMNQHNDMVGEAAVEMVVSMIHSNTVSVPTPPQSRLIGSTWINGRTVRLAAEPSAAVSPKR